MQALHPVMQQALRPFAPMPDVRCKVLRTGRINEYEFRSSDRQATQRAADVRMSAIDPYRSPAVVAQSRDAATGETVIVVRYYAMD